MNVETDLDGEVMVRAAVGARLLTARGAIMRVVSTAANVGLVFLVTPADLGLLAVVRGIAGLAGDASDLGFAWALLRRHEAPTKSEFRALAGVQLSIVLVFLGLALLAPSLTGSIGAIPAEWRRWMIAVLVTMLAVPFGTGARIRLEREMDYTRIARADVSGVLLQNLTLLGFAVVNHFTTGVFVATGVAALYSNLVLWVWSPGPLPGFQFRAWRALGREFAGFSLGHVGSLLASSATPLLVARLFGLSAAGIWSFATRLGNLLQLAFEGFRRAAIPAAALLARSPQGLRRLSQQSLLGAARLTLPLLTAAFIVVPLVGEYLPKWAAAVPITQAYLIGFGLAGIVGASLVPSGVALAGSRIVVAEQFAPVIVAWAGFGILAFLGRASIGWVVLPMHAATIVAIWRSTAPQVRPVWSAALWRPMIALGLVIVAGLVGRALGVGAILVALGSAAIAAIVTLGEPARSGLVAFAQRRYQGQP